MAKAAWLNVSPASGSGDASVNVSTLEAHTGRVARNTNVTFQAAGVTNKVVNVTQAGKPEFVSMQPSATAGKDGGNVTITGKSNSNKLTFTLGTGSLAIVLPATFVANSVATNNGTAIAGDPGASQEYDFSIIIPVPENTGVGELSKQVIVTDNGGQTATCNLAQAAGEAYLDVIPTTIELSWEGTAQSITVESNTTWEVV